MSDSILDDHSSPIDDLRAAINAKAIIHRLQRHALGQEEMSSSETAAAKFLLNKALPDMKALSDDYAEGSRHEDLLSILE